MRFSLACLVLVTMAVQDAVTLFVQPPLVITPYEHDLDRACDGVRCNNGDFCRVTKSVCGDKQPTYQPSCVPCVPKDADAVCNSRGYARAILLHEDKCCTGRRISRRRRNMPFNVRESQPHLCHLYASGPGQVVCPKGSYCAPLNRYDFSNVGVCCYKQDLKSVDQPTTNDDKTCGPCKEECGPRELCEMTVGELGQKTFTCKPKQYPGCPSRPRPCSEQSQGEACKTSKDCSKSYSACCPTDCSVDSFVCRPAIAY